MINNSITKLYKITYPIIQGGMVWCSGWKLVQAVSEAGGLGLLGSGSMDTDTLRYHIKKCKIHCNSFGVNVPLLYKHASDVIQLLIEEQVPIVFTSAGNPKTYTSILKSHNIVTTHVVSSLAFAQKAQEAGVDAIVAEGFEAGGHNGKDETTTMVLLQQLRGKLQVPIIAAGGIYGGEAMYAALALGAEGVQLGSRFAACKESSAHDYFKQKIRLATEGDTMLTLKELAPVRMIKNNFYYKMIDSIKKGISTDALKFAIKGKSKIGMFEGDTENGMLEIGQVSALIKEEETAQDIINQMVKEFYDTKNSILIRFP